jgi:hypothetical protein
MIFRITFKDPDGVSEGIEEAVHDSLFSARPELYEDEMDTWREVNTEKCDAAIKPFILYQEYITVEFDTDKGTCRIVPVVEMEHS